MGLVEYAKKELSLLGDDKMQQHMNANILELIRTFANQGHSGFSASYLISVLSRLMNFKPLTPLTGDESEWGDCLGNKDDTQQNKRCSAVFRKNHDNAAAYYIYGKVFSDNGGITWYTNRNSHVPITFPYSVPDKAEKVYLDGDRILTDRIEIEALYKRRRAEFDAAKWEEDDDGQ